MPSKPECILDEVWETLKGNHPMMEYMGAQGDRWLEEFRPLVSAAATEDEAYDLIDELVCRLNDYHTWFARPGRQWRFDGLGVPAIRADVVRDGRRKTVAIVAAAEENCPVSIGDEVLAIDDYGVRTALGAMMKYAVGSSEEARLRMACRLMLFGPLDKPVRLTVRSREGETAREVTLLRSQSAPPLPVVSSREADGIPIIAITSWASPESYDIVGEFDQFLERYRNHPYVVIDVRGNGGGIDQVADQVTGRFLAQPVISSIFFRRVPNSLNYERHIWRAEPRGPWRFEGRFALLIDEGCKSACEHFTSGMLAGGACLVGTTTDGACGGTKIHNLTDGALLCTSWAFDLHGKDPSAQHGIRPHIKAPKRLDDLRNGRDGAIEAAITWLRSGKRVPYHSQRSHTN